VLAPAGSGAALIAVGVAKQKGRTAFWMEGAATHWVSPHSASCPLLLLLRCAISTGVAAREAADPETERAREQGERRQAKQGKDDRGSQALGGIPGLPPPDPTPGSNAAC
jgi:hypothetical protein